jgi:gamma-glutamyltranspeptidase/glutathione hydrolase
MSKKNILKIVIAIVLVSSLFLAGQTLWKRTIGAQDYGVSSSNPIATKVGMNVLKNGGNAVDAAIAISYTLNVVEPYGSGIGGGGGMLISPPDKKATFLDYREEAPQKIDGEREGNSGVPGFVAGMAYAHDKYGSLNMNELLNPAIHYAKEGFKINEPLSFAIQEHEKKLDNRDAFYPDGDPLKQGDVLKQPELAETLEKIRDEGASAFYKGSIAEDIEEEGHISTNDLQDYEVKERDPVVGKYGESTVISAPPPFSGTTLIQMLMMMDDANLASIKSDSLFTHYMGQITKAAYKDRIEKLADPEFENQYAQDWTSSQYVNLLNRQLNSTNAGEQYEVDKEHESTTHFVVMDKEGTVVSTTNTLSDFFGSGDYTNGFFLNNQLQNFGDGVNRIESGKRPRTFMAPTVVKTEEGTIGIGSPGGDRIPQMVAQVLYYHMKEGKSWSDAVKHKRFAFDSITLEEESSLTKRESAALKSYGYKLGKSDNPMHFGSVQVLQKDEDGHIIGEADARRGGNWAKK